FWEVQTRRKEANTMSEAFLPTLRRKLMAGPYGSDTEDLAPEENFVANPGAEAYRPTLARTGETSPAATSPAASAFSPTTVYSPTVSQRQPDIVRDVYSPRMNQLAEQIDQQLQPRPMGKFR